MARPKLRRQGLAYRYMVFTSGKPVYFNTKRAMLGFCAKRSASTVLHRQPCGRRDIPVCSYLALVGGRVVAKSGNGFADLDRKAKQSPSWRRFLAKT